MKHTLFATALLVVGSAIVAVPTSTNAQPPAQQPCCHIIAIDGSSGIVTAKPMGTGASFRFKFDSGALPPTLRVDQFVWVHGQKVSINGGQNCCTMLPAIPNPGALLGNRISGGYKTSYSAESTSKVTECDQVAQRSFPQGGHKCAPKATMISSGKNPDGSDATYSWTCMCT